MSRYAKFVAILAAALAAGALTAQAVSVSGNITFTGSVNLDTLSAGTATAVTAWHGLALGDKPQVQDRDGSFVAFVTPGDGVDFVSPWSFASGPVAGFWKVDGFTFDLTSSSITSQGFTTAGGYVAVSGTGIISGNGFDATVGDWSFTTQDPASKGKFSFSASGSFVPDGGSTLLLLGSVFSGLACLKLRRK